MALKTEAKEKEYSDRRTCFFSERGFGVGVAIFDNADFGSIKTLNQDAHSITVGGRAALQSYLGTCTIYFQVAETVMVGASGADSSGDAAKACEVALKVANIVQPKLP